MRGLLANEGGTSKKIDFERERCMRVAVIWAETCSSCKTFESCKGEEGCDVLKSRKRQVKRATSNPATPFIEVSLCDGVHWNELCRCRVAQPASSGTKRAKTNILAASLPYTNGICVRIHGERQVYRIYN